MVDATIPLTNSRETMRPHSPLPEAVKAVKAGRK
jgi:hypothetical protein